MAAGGYQRVMVMGIKGWWVSKGSDEYQRLSKGGGDLATVTTPKTSDALVSGLGVAAGGFRRVVVTGKQRQPQKRALVLISGLGGGPWQLVGIEG